MSGLLRKKLTLPDFARTFFAPADCRNRSASYVNAQTKRNVSAILRLPGDDTTRLTALADNMLRFVHRHLSQHAELPSREEALRRPF